MKNVIRLNDATLVFKFVEDGSGFLTALHVKNSDDIILDMFLTPFMEGKDVFETFTSRITEHNDLEEELLRYRRNDQDREAKDRHFQEAIRAADAAQVYRYARSLFFQAQTRIRSNCWRFSEDVKIMEELQRLINEEELN